MKTNCKPLPIEDHVKILVVLDVEPPYSDLQNLRRGPFSFPGFEF